MRYDKGSIELNPKYDDEILRRVLHCGFVSDEQLWRFLSLEGHGLPRRSFNWRLRRLVAHGLLRQQKNVLLGRRRVYSIDRWGVAHLTGRGEYHVGVCDRLETASNDAWLLHALDLNEIRLTIQEAGVLVAWKSETEIRSRNEFTTFHYAKDYDAIVTVEVGGDEVEVALEYERTAKAAKKYHAIRTAIESETVVAQFLYLTVNYHLLNFVTQFFERSRKRIYFGLLDDLRREKLEMKVIDATSTRSESLRTVLQNGQR
jgi:hypothetical protein